MNGFTPEQQAALQAPLDRKHVATRQQSGQTLSYIESWRVIEAANRIFGFDGWESEVLEMRCTVERERKIGKPPNQRDGWGVSYICRVRVTVFAGERRIIREDYGGGHGVDADMGLAHESASKEAASDAQKRCLRTFGNPFGLALYDKTQAQVADETPLPRIQPAAFLERWQRQLAMCVDKDALEKLRADTAADRADVKAQDPAISAQVNAAYKARQAELAKQPLTILHAA